MGGEMFKDDSRLRTFDSNADQCDDEVALNANLDDGTPVVDLLPGHMRVPPQRPSLRGIDLHEVAHMPYAE
eukprot:416514-Alexandrium_andersonii.AAC.1